MWRSLLCLCYSIAQMLGVLQKILDSGSWLLG